MVNDPTIGGGTAFNDLLAILTGILGEQQTSRAGTGSGLLAALLGAEQTLRSSPTGLVDRLALAGEVGTMLPFSQGSQEQLRRYSVRPQGNLVEQLTDQLGAHAAGMIPQGQVMGVGQGGDYGPLVAVRLSDPGGGYRTEYISLGDWDQTEGLRTVTGNVGPFTVSNQAIRSALFQNEPALQSVIYKAAQEDPALMAEIQGNMRRRQQEGQSGGVESFQHGGRLRLDPRANRSTPGNVASPVTIRDRTGRTVATAGEGGRTEYASFDPSSSGGVMQPPPRESSGPPAARPRPVLSRAIAGAVPDKRTAAEVPQTTVLSAAEKFRLEHLRESWPDYPEELLLNWAQNPAELDAILEGQGVELDTPRLTASRLLAESMAGDLRFTEPLRRSLSLGRTLTPGGMTARDYTIGSPDFIGGLQSLIGEGNLSPFLFELAALSPTGLSGVRRRGRAGVIA